MVSVPLWCCSYSVEEKDSWDMESWEQKYREQGQELMTVWGIRDRSKNGDKGRSRWEWWNRRGDAGGWETHRIK